MRYLARIREQGAVLLDIPDNYYDDLEAKYDFAPGVAKALRDNHILYDRDDSGEFFQAYTRAFDDRFFFEIVQRKNYSASARRTQRSGLPRNIARRARRLCCGSSSVDDLGRGEQRVRDADAERPCGRAIDRKAARRLFRE